VLDPSIGLWRSCISLLLLVVLILPVFSCHKRAKPLPKVELHEFVLPDLTPPPRELDPTDLDDHQWVLNQI
jgi:hypothetical protein